VQSAFEPISAWLIVWLHLVMYSVLPRRQCTNHHLFSCSRWLTFRKKEKNGERCWVSVLQMKWLRRSVYIQKGVKEEEEDNDHKSEHGCNNSRRLQSNFRKASVLPQYTGLSKKGVKVESNIFEGMKFGTLLLISICSRNSSLSVVMSDPKSRAGDEDKKDIAKMYVCIIDTSFISI